MTEFDDLRRVAYGRTSSPAEESAAAAARAQLATHERRSLQVRAEREAAEFARARGLGTGPGVDATAESEAPGGVIVDVVEVYDDPGYLRRLGATGRVWAVPAFAAFVVGVMLTVASVLLVLNSHRLDDGSSPGTVNIVGEPTLVTGPGDLEAATAVLARPRESSDVIVEPPDFVEAESTRLLRSMSERSAYAATSTTGELCLIAISGPVAVDATCAPPSAFPAQGLTIARTNGSQTVTVHWDGVEVTETQQVSSAG
jgi:hypothetical protein